MAAFEKIKMLLKDIFPCLHTLTSNITSFNRIWDLKFDIDQRKKRKKLNSQKFLVKMVRSKLTGTCEGVGLGEKT